VTSAARTGSATHAADVRVLIEGVAALRVAVVEVAPFGATRGVVALRVAALVGAALGATRGREAALDVVTVAVTALGVPSRSAMSRAAAAIRLLASIRVSWLGALVVMRVPFEALPAETVISVSDHAVSGLGLCDSIAVDHANVNFGSR